MGFEISFADKSLRKTCENETTARKLLGDVTAKQLFSRLSDLRAADNINDIIAGNPHKLSEIEICIELGPKFNLVITGNHASNPFLDNGELDWSQINRIKILRIEESRHE